MLYPKHGSTFQCFDAGYMHGEIWNLNWRNYATPEKQILFQTTKLTLLIFYYKNQKDLTSPLLLDVI
jgi:hypothetical protein